MAQKKAATKRAGAAGGEGRQGVWDVYQGRIKRLRDAALRAGVTHVLVTDPKDVGYLTGFLGGDSYVMVPAAGVGKGPQGGTKGVVILSDRRYEEELEPVGGGLGATLYMRARGMAEAVADVGLSAGVQRMGVQVEHMTLGAKRAIEAKLGAERVVETCGLVGQLRVKKDEAEVKAIRKANRVQEAALEATLEQIGPGMQEIEVAAILEYEMKVRGSSEVGFGTIVAAQPNGSKPHYRPGTKKLAANKTVLIDWGAVVGGYHGDMTRVFAFGKWPKKMREVYEIVLESQLAGEAALRAGATTLEVDAASRKVIEDAGYGAYFGHGLGHGMGLDGHEDPRLSHMVEPVVLEAGMVVTIEPGVYLPGVGGVRLEDNYVVTAAGCKNLCRLPKDLDWATR